MSKPKRQIPDDELISAYHDGELNAADTVRAEQLLATQPEARQLLEELRALSATLSAAPRPSLGDDFPQRVIRQAEREMLAAAPVKPVKEVMTKAVERPRLLRWPQGRRPWVYVALAAAAALVLMLSRPDHVVQEFEVAHLGDAKVNRGEESALRGPTEMKAVATREERRTDGVELLHAGGMPKNSDRDADAAARFSKAGGPPADNSPAGGMGGAGAGGSPGLAAGGGAFQRPLGKSGDAVELGRAQEGLAAEGRVEVLRRLETLGLDATPKEELESQVLRTDLSLAGQPIANGVLVVECDVRRDAWNRAGLVTINRTLNDNGIAVQDEAVLADNLVDAKLSMRNTVRGGAGGNELVAGEPVDTFYVVATAPQLAATLDELELRKEVIVSVNVKPAPEAPVQETLQPANRRNAYGAYRGTLPSLKLQESMKDSGGEKLNEKVPAGVATNPGPADQRKYDAPGKSEAAAKGGDKAAAADDKPPVAKSSDSSRPMAEKNMQDIVKQAEKDASGATSAAAGRPAVTSTAAPSATPAPAAAAPIPPTAAPTAPGTATPPPHPMPTQTATTPKGMPAQPPLAPAVTSAGAGPAPASSQSASGPMVNKPADSFERQRESGYYLNQSQGYGLGAGRAQRLQVQQTQQDGLSQQGAGSKLGRQAGEMQQRQLDQTLSRQPTTSQSEARPEPAKDGTDPAVGRRQLAMPDGGKKALAPASPPVADPQSRDKAQYGYTQQLAEPAAAGPYQRAIFVFRCVDPNAVPPTASSPAPAEPVKGKAE